METPSQDATDTALCQCLNLESKTQLGPKQGNRQTDIHTHTAKASLQTRTAGPSS